ncbi:hypothetical protein LP419_20695 [Massilia sp. H-1]|nr:hypothetical protein LP419_20695 [Massilia sp. H-1]
MKWQVRAGRAMSIQEGKMRLTPGRVGESALSGKIEIMLLLVVYPHQHANKFSCNLSMMFVQTLQIGD